MNLKIFKLGMWGIVLFFLIILLLSFFLFTFYPPHVFLFQDLISGQYGIIKNTENKSKNEPILKIKDAKIFVEIADNPEKRTKGLSFRESLDEDRGMLFVFERPSFYYFSMRDMNFPLDFIWINGDEVVDITENVEPEDFQPSNSFTSRVEADKVLEVNAGFVEKFKIKIGDKVSF